MKSVTASLESLQVHASAQSEAAAAYRPQSWMYPSRAISQPKPVPPQLLPRSRTDTTRRPSKEEAGVSGSTTVQNPKSAHRSAKTAYRSGKSRGTAPVASAKPAVAYARPTRPVHQHKWSSTADAIAAFDTLSETSAGEIDRQPIGNFMITAYALTKNSTGKVPGQPGFGITSSGTHAFVGRTIAVDPSVIPIGSLVYIDLPGVGWRIAEDTGGAIRGRHIDLLLPSDGAAIRFGVKRKVSVYAMPR